MSDPPKKHYDGVTIVYYTVSQCFFLPDHQTKVTPTNTAEKMHVFATDDLVTLPPAANFGV